MDKADFLLITFIQLVILFVIIEFNSNNYLLSGHPAFRTITMQSSHSPETKVMSYGTVLAGKGYSITYMTSAENFPIFLQTAQSMIDSFQIISKQ